MENIRKISKLILHCTGGYGDVESIKRYWKNNLGWKQVGYHRIVDLKGNIHKLADFQEIVNGVRGYNSDSIHISYIGGVDKNDYSKAKDTRNELQKEAILNCIEEALIWIDDNGQDVCEITIEGHRDVSSTDSNNNGVIDEEEFTKYCPSFNAKEEYKDIIDEFVLNDIE